MREAREAGRAIRRAAADVVEGQRAGRMRVAVVTSVEPELSARLSDSSIVLEEEDLRHTQDFKMYLQGNALEVGDTLLVTYLVGGTEEGEWAVVGVQSDVEPTGGSDGSGGHTIRDEGVVLAQRTSLDFVGGAVEATDDPGGDRTIVTLDAPTTEEMNDALAGKSDVGHNHDERYYTAVQVNDMLAAKQDAATAATDAELSAHTSDTTGVHGIADTSLLATDAEVATAVETHRTDTTDVHGIPDTSLLATDAEVAAAVATHEADTSVHGIADTTALATDAEVATAVGDHSADTTSVHGIADTAALYRAGGTDVAVADGGTGASSAATARTNLGAEAQGARAFAFFIG